MSQPTRVAFFDAAETLLRSAYTYRDGGSAWDAFPEEWRRAGRENARAALADFRNSIGSYPSATDLATLEVPVVCSYGARSPDGMFRLVRSLAAAIPTARTLRIEGAGHAQQPPGLRRQPSDGSFGVLVRLEALETALEVHAPGLRHAHAAGGPIEQADAVPLLDGGDVLRDRGARHTQIPRGRREARALRHAREDAHHLQSVHGPIVALFRDKKQSISITTPTAGSLWRVG